MKKIELNIDGALELTDEELAQIQGGGLGSWLKKAAKSVVSTVKDIFTGKIFEDLVKKLPKLPEPPVIY